MKTLNAQYWEERYDQQKTGWDIGYPSPALVEYFTKQVDLEAQILIPGAGHAYEAEYLLEKGFKNVTVLDWSATALKEALERAPILNKATLHQDDFFKHQGQYDYLMEQTFFCALSPSMRKEYAEKCHSLLKKSGRLIGLLFDFPLSEEGPPYGGSYEEYKQLFEAKFHIKRLEKAKNSIKPRQGREFFIELIA